ncbi:hypothetical protein BRM02_12890 [Xanthomonas oryzae pv. oryzae]|nr:hypothetical protein BRM02_12890 [Xanthomonas oryzae pv. oryzae]
MRAPSSTAWPTKCLISQEEMWGNLSFRYQCAGCLRSAWDRAAATTSPYCSKRTSSVLFNTALPRGLKVFQ